MMATSVIRSEFFRGGRIHLGIMLSLFYVGMGLLYVMAGAGAWVSAGTGDWFIGFSADVSYFELNNIGDSITEHVVAASLAHALLFPAVAVVVVGSLFASSKESACMSVSRARGVTEASLYLAWALVASTWLVLGYAVFTLICFAAYTAAGRAGSVVLLIHRLFLCTFLNVSYVVLCVTAFALLRVKALVSGGLIVATYAGLIAAMASPGDAMPMHMFYWMRVCGVGALHSGLEVIVFSFASVIACILALCVSKVLRYRRG